MNIWLVFVFVLLLLAMAGSIWAVKKGDKNYIGSAKKNTKNLTAIYAVVILLSIIALGVYISKIV